METSENNIMPHITRLGTISPLEYELFTEAKNDFQNSNFYGVDPGRFTQPIYFEKMLNLLKSYFYTTARPSDPLIPEEYASSDIGLNNLTRTMGRGFSLIEGATNSVYVLGPDAEPYGERMFSPVPENERGTGWSFDVYPLLRNLSDVNKRQINATISVLALKFYYEYIAESYSSERVNTLEKMLEEKSILEKLVITNE